MLKQGGRDESIGFKSFNDLKSTNSAFIVFIRLEDQQHPIAVTRIFLGRNWSYTERVFRLRSRHGQENELSRFGSVCPKESSCRRRRGNRGIDRPNAGCPDISQIRKTFVCREASSIAS